MKRAELTVTVDVGAPAGALWQAVTDWPGQGRWMLGTRVSVDGPAGAADGSAGGAAHGGVDDGRHLGARLTAVTGVGPLGVTDRMEIVEWEPPRRCVVRHVGRVIRGDGVFEVVELGPGRSRFVWSELLDLPLGALGRLGWPVVRPAMRWGVRVSLDRMARQVEAAHRAGDPAGG